MARLPIFRTLFLVFSFLGVASYGMIPSVTFAEAEKLFTSGRPLNFSGLSGQEFWYGRFVNFQDSARDTCATFIERNATHGRVTFFGCSDVSRYETAPLADLLTRFQFDSERYRDYDLAYFEHPLDRPWGKNVPVRGTRTQSENTYYRQLRVEGRENVWGGEPVVILAGVCNLSGGCTYPGGSSRAQNEVIDYHVFARLPKPVSKPAAAAPAPKAPESNSAYDDL